MAKDTSYYFSHDFNARQDAKIKRLIMKHGMAGYGMFWAIVEDLYNNANALPTDYESIAFDLRTDSETIESIITGFDLFIINQNTFGSMSIQKRLDEREEKSKKAKKAARIRWGNNDGNADAMQTHTDSNAIKEKKGEESKENEIKEYNNTDSPTESSDNVDALDTQTTDATKDVCKNNKRPTIDLVIDYFVKNGYSKEAAAAAFEYYEAGTEPRQMYWRDSRGNPVKNWKQKMRGVWFKEENKVADDSAGDLEDGWRFVPMSEAYEIVRDLSFTSMHEAELRGEADEYVSKVMNARVQYEVHGNAWKTRK